MGAVWIYCIALMILVLLSFWRKWNSLGKMLLIMYSFVAVIALWIPEKGSLQYVKKLDPSNLTYPLVIFMIIAYILFFSPFLKKNARFNVAHFQFKINSNYSFFAKVYIVFAFVTLILYSREVISLLQSGDWTANRLAMASHEAIYPYSNVLEKLIILFVNYFQLLALIVGFMMLKDEVHKKLGTILIVLASACEITFDLYVSSRGMLANYVLFILALYFFFYSDIDKSSKKFIKVIGIALAAIVGPYLVDVTISRFSGAVVNSLVYYFGQQPYVFGLQVKTVSEFQFGRYAFGVLFGDEKFAENLGDWVRLFYTFLGWLYIDWGFVGIIVIGILCALFFGGIVRKKNFRLCDVYILFAYYQFLVQGTFTIGRTKIYSIVITVIIYFFLKFFAERYTFSIGGRRLK